MNLQDYALIKKVTLTDIGNGIREKEGSEGLIPTTEMSDRIKAIETGSSVNYLNYMRQCSFHNLNLFGTKKVELTLPMALDLNAMFNPKTSTWDEAVRNTTVEEIIINCPNKINSMQSFVSNGNYTIDSTLKKITLNVDFSESSTWGSAFKGNKALEIIDGNPLNFSNTTSISNLNSIFERCESLREVRFAGSIKHTLDMKICPLSKTSILSVTSCLSPDVTGMTLTLKKTAVDTAFETSQGAADGSSSTEWTAIVDSHSNWTISLI